MEIKANCDCTVYDDRDKHRADRKAGSVYFALSQEDNDHYMWYYCPCGCGVLSVLRIGLHVKPEESPSWAWDADMELPTLMPSVHWRGHWHGYLRQGKWESV